MNSPLFPSVSFCKTLLLFMMLLAPLAQAAPSPMLIPFQGTLTDQKGTPYTQGQYTLLFVLYDTAIGGTPLWSETHQKVGVIQGTVNVFLGSIHSLESIDFSQTRYLGITIDADNNPNTPDPEMIPRQMIIPAFAAKNSEKLAGYDWSSILVSGNDPVTGKIAGDKVSGITPHGGIIMWSGSVSDIPVGWALCDGNNGTPDLRNRFIVGGGSDYAVGNKGGTSNHNHLITVGGHALTADEMPSHSHDILTCFRTSANEWPAGGFWDILAGDRGGWYRTTTDGGNLFISAKGGNAPHAHDASSQNGDHRPPYYALAFIMKL